MQGNARQMLPSLMAVVPAYNEAQNIAKVVHELATAHPECASLSFVVVDDGSTDSTRAQARATGAQVISLPFNMGIGAAVQTGFQYALRNGATIVAQVDGDGQHIPGELGKLLIPLTRGEADVVVGSRFVSNPSEGLVATTRMRWLAGRLLSKTVQALTGQRITDTTSGFRAYSREAAAWVAENYPDDYPEVQVLVALARRGFRIVEVPVRMRGRAHGRSSINWWRAIYYIVKVSFASFMDRVRK